MATFISPAVIRHTDFGEHGFALIISTGLADPVHFQSYASDRTPNDLVAYDDERMAIARFDSYCVSQEQLIARLR